MKVIEKLSCKKQDAYSILPRYLNEPENLGSLWTKEDEQRDSTLGIKIGRYTLRSQHWPKKTSSFACRLWEHTLVVYRPLVLHSTQALLFINGGTRYTNHQSDNPPPHQLNFANLSAETGSVIIDLQDVPNQYLTMEDNRSLKGDAMLAYTWGRYLEHPQKNEYWPLYFPMTKAVIKAMDAVQDIILEEEQQAIDKFMVTGISKRGLAAWLAALSDDRINALVPIAIDILNTAKNMKHIYASYNNQWPPAFHDFQNEKIMTQFENKTFEQLMNIEDPLSYMQSANGIYKKRLSIPKYIISASGDDFFVPDSLNLYFDQLPGESKVRVVPNESHFINMKIIETALLSYYQSIVQQSVRPTLKWKTNKVGALCQVVADKCPQVVTLWQAENTENRDFRLAAGISYYGQEVEGRLVDGHYCYDFTVPVPQKGWKAHFVEVSFSEDEGLPFILTTPSFIF